ncbi:hypothetical protein SESBI_48192 [Sesbania bispinosa]|nr:hypothetical protein SESBI_48192 [Sesbania bispinosa]
MIERRRTGSSRRTTMSVLSSQLHGAERRGAIPGASFASLHGQRASTMNGHELSTVVLQGCEVVRLQETPGSARLREALAVVLITSGERMDACDQEKELVLTIVVLQGFK